MTITDISRLCKLRELRLYRAFRKFVHDLVPFPRAGQLLSRLSLTKSPPVPLFRRVVIELQSNCNRECYFCCRESDNSGKRKAASGKSVIQFMPSERITK